MAISVRCDACRRVYHLNERLAGRLVQCRQCGAAIQVPSPSGTFGAPAPLPAYPAEPVYPGLAEFADASGSFPAPLQPVRRKASHGPLVFIALVAGTFIGLAVVAVMMVALSLGGAGGGDPGKGGGNGLLSSIAAPKRERNAVRPITAPAEAPVAAVAKPAATTPEPPYAGPSPEPNFQQILAAIRQVTASLAAIRDEATARQRQAEVTAGVRKWVALFKQLETDFPTIPAAEVKRLKDIYEPQMKAVGEELRRETERVGRIPGAGQILAHTLQTELRNSLSRPFSTMRARASATRRSGAGKNKIMASLMEPASAPAGDPFARYAEREVVEIVVQKLPGNVNEFISDRIHALSNCVTWTTKGGGDSMRVTIAPISDVRALAAKIDFGRVVTIDESQSMIVIEADAARLPKPLLPEASNPLDANFYRRNLDDLSSWSAGRRRTAAHRLKEAAPKELRPEIARAFLALMKDPNRQLRSVAIEAAPIWASADEAVPVLIEALHDSDIGLVGQVIKSLARFRDLRAVGPLCEQANKHGHQVREALRAIGEPAEPEVLKYLNHPEEEVRKAAIEALGDIGTAQCVPFLQNLSQDSNFFIQVSAKRALEQVQRRRLQQGT